MNIKITRTNALCGGIKLLVIACLFAEYFLGTRRTDPLFLVETIPSGGDGRESVVREIGEPRLFFAENAPLSHSASLAELSDGRLMAVWYAGSREGAKDVKIYQAVFPASGQAENDSTVRVLLDRETLAQETKRIIRKLGNPVIFSDQKRLRLWVVSVSFGGWSGSSLNEAVSDDDGQTWSAFRRLKTSPLLNLSNLVRAEAVPMTDQCVGLPVYHELIYKYSHFFVLDRAGKILRRSRIPADEEGLQPTIAASDGKNALALMRTGTTDKARKILAAQTSDAGLTWQKLPSFPLSNLDSSVSLIRTPTGKFLAAANPAEGRMILNFFGANQNDPLAWNLLATLEKDEEHEYSYPSLLMSKNSTVHLVYTWKRLGIKYRRFCMEPADELSGEPSDAPCTEPTDAPTVESAVDACAEPVPAPQSKE